MARMIGHDAYWGYCCCRDCHSNSWHATMKRNAKRRERQTWKQEVWNEVPSQME